MSEHEALRQAGYRQARHLSGIDARTRESSAADDKESRREIYGEDHCS
jgi:hypothetical protein